MHIAQGVFKSLNVNTCTKSGGDFVFWVADFFALMNDKMGGDLDKIKVVGEYLVEVWKAAGMNMEKVQFVWASDAIVERADVYSRIVADIARRFTVARLTKCCQIMGRKEGNLSAAQVLYPIMQCADVFFLEADVCQLGLDQRKVNMLARDYAQVSGRRFKPVILSHHMLFGLKQGQEKMSKSDSESAIFMEDTAEDVARKINAAYCPSVVPEEEKDSDDSLLLNPCLDYVKHICFHGQDGAEFAGFKTYKEVRRAFVTGELSEERLKQGLIDNINSKLQPVREHFASGRPHELLESIKRFKAEAAEKEKKKQEAKAKAQELGGPDGPDDDDIAMGRRKKTSDLPPIRRCQPKALEGKPASCVVFLPAPKTYRGIPVADVLSVAIKLTRAMAVQTVEEHENGEKVVLFVPDLGFICQNCLADQDSEAALKRKIDDKGPFASVGRKSSPTMEIEAYIDAFVSSVKAVVRDPSSFVVVKQSELMNEDPMNYLLSVINVGRSFKLEEVLPAVGIQGDLEGGRVGFVIDALFHVADVLALGPARRVITDARQEPLANLAIAFFHTAFSKDFDCGTSPLKVRVDPPEIRLVKTPEDTDVESIVYVSDDDKEVASKIKRAFCEIGNVALNPVLNGLCALLETPELAHLFALPPGSVLHVKRSPENGGDVEFKSVSEIFGAFAKGTTEGVFPPDALHPGDLKASVTPLIKAMVEKARKAVPAQATKVLDACRKRNPERIVLLH